MAYNAKVTGQINEVRRLTHAANTFHSVIDACHHMPPIVDPAKDRYYNVYIAGICITYMRPFGANVGLGPLRAEYREFPGRIDLQYTHEDLEKGRNWVFAHTDLAEGGKLLPPGSDSVPQDRIRIRIDAMGVAQAFSPFNVWEPARIPAIVELAQFQYSRVSSSLDKLLKDLAAGAKYPPGEYILGENYP